MYQMTTLHNGLRILTYNLPHTFSASVCIFVGAGSRYETDEQAGISHFVEHVCFKGTERRPTSKEISETIERTGGIINGSTDREHTVYWCKTARSHFPEALDLLVDMTRYSVFDSQEIDRERMVIQEELNMSNDHPSQRVDVLIDDMLWPNHSMGRDVAGSKESVQEITRDMLLDYWKRQYIPSNAVISVAGDIDHEDVVGRVASLLDDWPSNTPLSWDPAHDGQSSPQLRLEQRKTDQAHICVALHGLPSQHPDRYALNLLSAILGEGMSSRLFMELREKQGLAYDVHSGVSHFRDCGALFVYTGTDPSRSKRAIGAILEEIGKMRDGVTEEELSKVKEMSTGRLALRMEDTRAVASWGGIQELINDRLRTVDEVISSINAVAAEDVQRVAQSLLLTEKLNLAIVGPYRSQLQFQPLLKL